MMKYPITYSKLVHEFYEPMTQAGLNFEKEYLSALNSFNSIDLDHDERYEAIRNVLQEILNQYAQSEAKTKGGRVARFFAKLAAIFLPFANKKK